VNTNSYILYKNIKPLITPPPKIIHDALAPLVDSSGSRYSVLHTAVFQLGLPYSCRQMHWICQLINRHIRLSDRDYHQVNWVHWSRSCLFNYNDVRATVNRTLISRSLRAEPSIGLYIELQNIDPTARFTILLGPAD